VARKSGADRDYIEIAKNNALNDLASQIRVTITSSIIRDVFEKAGVLEEEFNSHIQSTTRAEIEGYELVDTWEDKVEYWIYYRLSRRQHEERIRRNRERAIELSMDLFLKAKGHEDGDRPEKALLFYIRSIQPIENHLMEPLETEYENSKVYLQNEIYSSLESLLSRIELTPVRETVRTKIGKAAGKPLELIAYYKNNRGVKHTASSLPVAFSFTTGAGELIPQAKTDRSGKASCRVRNISAIDTVQRIRAELDLPGYAGEKSLSIVQKSILQSLTIPHATFILQVDKPTIFIDSEEIHQGGRLSIEHIEPVLKERLSAMGYNFSNRPAEADFTITIRGRSKEGSETYGMYSASADMTISVIDTSSGKEIYKNARNDIKGIHLDWNRAGLKAFENAAAICADELLPDLLERLRTADRTQ
jgi:hypothetical protein